MSMHDSCQHTRAHTCRDHSHTLELRWWRVWRWFALAPQTIIHTNIHTVCMCVCVNLYILVACLPFWVNLTTFCLTLCFSSIQWTSFRQKPVVGPVTRRFCRAFITSVSVRVSRDCLQSTVLEWKCWMCVSVCTYECIWQLFDLTSNFCCTCIAPQYCIYTHQDTRTYMYRQTDRHSGGHMHAHVHVHACVLISFLFFRWKHSRIQVMLH
jgi:hypothetical protein